MPFESLLVATDFSDNARQATYRAAALAAANGAQLELLHVMSRSSLDALREVFREHPAAQAALIGDVESMLSEEAANVAAQAGVNTNSRVSIGNVLDDILAATANADMLVVGAHGLNPLRDALLGTTAERLLRKCKRPVLVVKRPPRGAYENVLVPVDFSAHSAAALNLAVRVAPTAKVIVAHAFDVPFEGQLRLAEVSIEHIEHYRAQARQQALSNMHALTRDVRSNAQRFMDVVEQGDPRRIILAKEKLLGVDLIVISKHASAVEDFFVGSVTRRILSDANCDVLVDTTGVR